MENPGWFRRTFLRAKGISLSSPEALRLLGAPISAAGVRISAESAMAVPAVRAAVQLIAGTISALDVCFVRKGRNGERRELSPTDYAPARVMCRPNGWSNGVAFRRDLIADYLLHGAAFARVIRLRGEPAELIRLDPRSTSVLQDVNTWEPTFRTTIPGASLELGYRDVVWLRNLSLDGMRGRGILEDGAEAIGVAVVLELYVGALFASGARPGGVLKSDKKLTAEAAKRLAEAWKAVTGKDSTGAVAILEEGLSWESLGLTNADADTRELRLFQIAEIGRLFGVSPILLGDLSKSNLNNAEAAQRTLLTMTLLPLIELIEDELERVLLPPEDRDSVSIEFDVSGFVRADVEKQAVALRAEVETGVLTVNEARAQRGRGPVSGGDKPQTTVQSRPLDAPAATSPKGTST